MPTDAARRQPAARDLSLPARHDARSRLLARMRKAQDDLIAELWPKRKEGLPSTTPEEAVKLASIVEKETGARLRAAAHRRGVRQSPAHGHEARIRSDHHLRPDQGPSARPRPCGRASSTRANPYSTYQIIGLPPTPICQSRPRCDRSPCSTRRSREELYFVANGTGGHVFARTIAEHEPKRGAQWRRIERDRE